MLEGSRWARAWTGWSANSGLLIWKRLPAFSGPRVNFKGQLPPLRWVSFVLVVVVAVVYEVKTSVVQSWVFSQLSKRLTYTVAAGPSPNIVFPKSGPFDKRLGYTRLSDFQKRLESASYRVTEQARFSPDLARLANWGISPPYRLPALP
jgi:hypothetical protein